MKKNLFLFFFLSHFSLSAQVIEEKVIQKATGESLDAISKFGLKSVIKGSGDGSFSRAMIAAFEVTKLDDDGFVVRNGYSFKKFDKNMNQVWETTLTPSMGLQARPFNVSIGNKDLFYFIELTTIFNIDVFITQIDNTGKATKTKYWGEKEDKKSNTFLSYFISEKGLNILELTGNKKEARHTFCLLTFSKTDLALNRKDIKGLEPNEIEIEKTNFSTMAGRLYMWNQLTVMKDKVILVKKYRAETKKSTEEDYLVKTIELDLNGEVSNAKNFILPNTEIHRWPSVELSTNGKELYIFGYTATDSEIVTDGIFIDKYNYETSISIFKKEYKNATIAPNVKIENTTKGVYLSYPTVNMVEGVYEFNNNNGELNFTLYKGQKTGFSHPYYYSVNIDTDGKVSSVNELEFGVPPIVFKRYLNNIVDTKLYENPIYNGGIFIRAKVVKNLYATKSSKPTSPIDFILSKSGPEVTHQTFYSVLPMSDSNVILEINDNTSEIKMYKMKK